jgi:hypothetical protein
VKLKNADINGDNQRPLVEELYDVTDIMRIFKCGKTKARLIMQQKGFPRMTVGREVRVVPSKLNEWINRNYNKHVTTG